MHRIFLSPQELHQERLTLSDDRCHHLHVLRLQVGAELLLLDGRGGVGQGVLAQISRSRAEIEMVKRWEEEEDVFKLRLLQSLPKGEKFEWLLEKGVELGISTFTPVITERSQLRGEKIARWQKIIQEAARQSRRPILPQLQELQSLESALKGTSEELRLILWEEGSIPLNATLPATPPADCAILVGPEGGFSPHEVERAVAAGFSPVSLGRRILRTETAGMALAAILQNRYGDFGR